MSRRSGDSQLTPRMAPLHCCLRMKLSGYLRGSSF